MDRYRVTGVYADGVTGTATITMTAQQQVIAPVAKAALARRYGEPDGWTLTTIEPLTASTPGHRDYPSVPRG